MHTSERLHESFVDTSVGVNRVFRGLMPSASTSELSRQLFARALRDLPMTKDALLDPWVDTCLAVWGLRGVSKSDTNNQDIVRSVAPNLLRSVLTRKWNEAATPRNDETLKLPNPQAAKITPETVKLSSEQENVVRFLGFKDERTFMNEMPEILQGKIDKIMSGVSEGEIHQALKIVFEFAEAGYGTRSPRKGGESYYCHALRVLYYTLDHLVETGTHVTSPQDMIDIVTITLLHDAIEDFKGFTALPFTRTPETEGERGHKFNQRRNSQHGSQYKYHFDQPEGTEAKTILVSDRAHRCIQTLTSPEVETDADKFRKVIVKSPWSVVEVIKSMDRLDNVLTYIFPTDSWWKYLYKMYESTLGMSRLSTAAEVTHPLERRPKIDHHPPGEFVAYGMLMNALYGIRKEFLDKIAEYEGMSLRRNFSDELEDQSLLTLDDHQYAGIEIMLQRVVNRMQNPEESRAILSVKDLKTYEEEIKDKVNNWKSFGQPVPGYGQRPYQRRRTKMDTRIRYARALSDASMVVGVGAFSAGVTSGIVLHDLSEGKVQKAMIESFIIGTGLILGGFTGKKLSDEIYNRRPSRRLI